MYRSIHFEFQEEESICKKSNNCMQYPIDLKMMIDFSQVFFAKRKDEFHPILHILSFNTIDNNGAIFISQIGMYFGNMNTNTS